MIIVILDRKSKISAIQISNKSEMASQITQIDYSDPYLYNFNTEVRLILEAVVARTVEESLRESLTEEEDKITRLEFEAGKCKHSNGNNFDRKIFKNHEDEMLSLKIFED